MLKQLVLGLVVVSFLAGMVNSCLAQDEGEAKLRGELPRVLQEAAPDELVPVYFVLADQLTGSRLLAKAEGIELPLTRRQVLLRALKTHAAASQAHLRGLLVRLESEKKARHLRYLWIGNIIAAELTSAEVRALARLDEVEHVSWSPKVDISLGAPPLSLPLDPQPSARPIGTGALNPWLAPAEVGVDEIECGVDLMRAPKVWNELGVTGEGVVVAVIDSGVCWSHPDIEKQIWVNPGEDLDKDGVVMDADDQNGIDDDGNGYVDDLIGYDIDNHDNDPNDNNSHGSHVAGTVAGDGTSGTQAGMAPDAKIMVVRVGLQFSDEPDVWEAMQYAADNGADVISMSLGWPHSQNPDRATWRTNCENTINLGTAMVIAAGNEGSGHAPNNIRTPGDVPRVITVAAVDCSDNIASFSSRGPVTWQDVPAFGDWPYPPGLTKPDVAGPGVNTKSHRFCSGYSTKSGTSMATPHVAGAAALMLSRNGALKHDDIKMLLEDTAVDLGDPGKDNLFGKGRVDAYEAVLLSATSDGTLSIREQATNCGGTLTITVSDTDLKGSSSLTVKVTSQSEPAGETATLSETGANTGVFKGSINVAPGDPTSDGVVQVVDGDVVTATYIDADDGHGGTNVSKTDSADIDCTVPRISNVRAEDLALRSAKVRWDTDEVSTSFVIYGAAIPPSVKASAPGFTASHSVSLRGLAECTVYYYSVSSEDAYGNLSRDDNGGQYFHFETLGDFGEGPQSCHGGRVTIDGSRFSCSDTVKFWVTDLDLNHDPEVIETATLELSSTSEDTPEIVVVTETAANSSKFSGSITTAAGAPAPDGLLQVADGDVITASYRDADDGSGSAAVSFDTARVDCTAAQIRDITVNTITDARATIAWTTNEPADSVLEWGMTPDLGQTVSDAGLKTSHSVLLNKFTSCGKAYFRIRATNEFGLESMADLGGAPFTFSLGKIPGLYWKADFESGAAGWTLEGEWEIGAPQRLGGSSGHGDPLEAYNNNNVLGYDLSGQGTWPGDYEPDSAAKAVSPVSDASHWTNTKLIFHRHLHVGAGDDASLWLWTDSGVSIYLNEKRLVDDSTYTVYSQNLAQLVDGAPRVSLEFQHTSNGSGQYAGWNVDEIIFKDGTLPDYGACATCGDAPSFAGARSVVDNDACGRDGVTISWPAAVSWGTGGGGSYAVYRDTSPVFTPSATHLIASGITGLSYNDTLAPADQQLYYIVRAESDESCSSGPYNGGVVDSNLMTVGLRESTSQPTPGVVNDLRVRLLARAHLRLEWSAPEGAVVYNVYRSEQPGGGFIKIAETTKLFYDDLKLGANKKSYYYKLRAANACGVEGP